MINVPFETLGDPGTFDLTDKTDPLYYIARFNHECSMNLYAISNASGSYTQITSSDATSLDTDLLAWAGSFSTWLTSAFDAYTDDLPVPAPPSLPSLPFLPIPAVVIEIVARVVFSIIQSWIRRRLAPGTEMEDVTKILMEIKAVLKEALIGGTDPDEYPLLESVAATPINVSVSKDASFQELTFVSPTS